MYELYAISVINLNLCYLDQLVNIIIKNNLNLKLFIKLNK